MLKKISVTLCLVVLCLFNAKAAGQLEETMFESGKIYTFLAVALIVLGGILFYLLRLDVKVSRLEKEMNEK
ncbi:MAG: CcmD family protein [Bacteroidota bacterium]